MESYGDQDWETRIEQAVTGGIVLDLTEGTTDEEVLPDEGRPWPIERVIPASVIRRVLRKENLAPDSKGLRIRGALIQGQLDLTHVESPCPVLLDCCQFDEQVCLDYAQLPALSLRASRAPALSLDGARVRADLDIRKLSVDSGVRAVGAQVGGRLGLREASLRNAEGVALNLSQATLTGGVLAKTLNVEGAIRANGARIGGQFDVMEANLRNPRGVALTLDGATVTGSVRAEDLTVDGETRMNGAQVGGQLILVGAKLRNPDGDALDLSQATLTGGVFAERLTAEGAVRANGAQLGWGLGLRDATLRNPGGYALILEQARLPALFLPGTHAEPRINLNACSIGNLVVGQSPHEGKLGAVAATGWQVSDLHGYMRSSRKKMATWLDRDQQSFVAQPWHEIAALYDRIGQPSDARRMRAAAAWRTTRQSPLPSRLVRLFYGGLVGYGHYWLLPLLWLTLAALSIFAITSTHLEAFTPTSPAIARPAATAAAPIGVDCPSWAAGEVATGATNVGCLAEGYPSLSPLLYAVTTVTPASSLQNQAWAPTDPNQQWIAGWLTFLKTCGWALTALLIAGVTGLLRRV